MFHPSPSGDGYKMYQQHKNLNRGVGRKEWWAQHQAHHQSNPSQHQEGSARSFWEGMHQDHEEGGARSSGEMPDPSWRPRRPPFPPSPPREEDVGEQLLVDTPGPLIQELPPELMWVDPLLALPPVQAESPVPSPAGPLSEPEFVPVEPLLTLPLEQPASLVPSSTVSSPRTKHVRRCLSCKRKLKQ